MSLSACAATDTAAVSDEMADFKRQAVEVSPVTNAIAASNTFYFCGAHPQADRFDALCEACDVDLYFDKDLPFNADPAQDAPVVGLKAYATHYYHEYKPWHEGEAPRITVTGERGRRKFEAREVTPEAAHDLFDQANAWCQARRDGEFLVRKEEIDAMIVEAGQ